MPNSESNTKLIYSPSPVPSQRLSRLWHLGRATGELAVGVGLKGLIELARNHPQAQAARIQISAGHARRFAERLAELRGAVMKLGQLMSMDADLLTPEVSAALGDLRERAAPMPLSQLVEVLTDAYGRDWDRLFRRFEFTPIAAASIGQVHRAETRDGRTLALKIQFPGVRASIDGDIANLGLIVRALGLGPQGIDVRPFLEEARRQLHREADYEAEAEALERYRAQLGDDPDLGVPAVHRDLTRPQILAMDLAAGVPIDRLAEPEYRCAERDRAAALLMRLTLRELFEFGLVQTDPNLANYLYDRASGRIILLDFGATVPLGPQLVGCYRQLAQALIQGDRLGIRDAAIALGYVGAHDPPNQIAALLDLLELAAEPLRSPGVYDFGSSDLFERVYRQGRMLFQSGVFSSAPAPETLFVHRKLMGSFMLARRLRARVELAKLAELSVTLCGIPS